MTTCDLEGAVFIFILILSARKKLFQLVGILGVADTVAELDHSIFEVSGLPRVQEMIRGGQGKYVIGAQGICLLDWMAV